LLTVRPPLVTWDSCVSKIIFPQLKLVVNLLYMTSWTQRQIKFQKWGAKFFNGRIPRDWFFSLNHSQLYPINLRSLVR
jgi:hypothetical protein